MHFLLSYTHEPYGRATTLAELTAQLRTQLRMLPIHESELIVQEEEQLLIDTHRKANATLLMLARNSDLDGAIQSMRSLEDRFNKKFQYPWVFLNEEPFTEEFMRCVNIVLFMILTLTDGSGV